jgi:hypothetical protein
LGRSFYVQEQYRRQLHIESDLPAAVHLCGTKYMEDIQLCATMKLGTDVEYTTLAPEFVSAPSFHVWRALFPHCLLEELHPCDLRICNY